ncbi:MAG: hypothetical protein IKX23_07810 [Treponema sp.]|nr:hypothetical protein [Treponema sp.]
MNDSTETTNELDSYGVWIKNDESNASENSVSDSDLNFPDSLDLPEFDLAEGADSDNLDDMFNDDSSIINEADNDDTTLSEEELNNIPTENTSIDSFNTDDFSVDTNTEVTIPSVDDFSDFGDISAETKLAEEPVVETEPVFESEPALETETNETGSEEELSLDDFMEGGFSDESVASGNNGYEEGKNPSTEEVSLDDFIDMDSFETDSPAASSKEEIVDEKPLDMDIAFDSSADMVQTEENTSIDADSEMNEEEYIQETASAPEEDVRGNTEITNSSDVTEELDLSEFGIDADAEETPVIQDVESEKVKETVVDYDLSVGNENMSSAPVVNVISEDTSEIPEAEEINEVEVIQEAEVKASPAILQQIVDDLSNLKNEINSLKSNLEQMKHNPAVTEDPLLADIETKDQGGFFGSDDNDDIIALSTDELSNIMNNVEVTAEEASDEQIDVVEQQEPTFDETAVDISDIAEETIEDDLPSEISIPTDSESLAEENGSSDPTVSFDAVEGIPSFEESDSSEKFNDVFETIPETKEPTFDIEVEDFAKTENTFTEPESFVTEETSNNKLSESNIDYLTKDEPVSVAEDDSNSDLKKDIKSVLLYMDQLLENLPEDKIEEFAKSEEFSTYKKLFSELGLS